MNTDNYQDPEQTQSNLEEANNISEQTSIDPKGHKSRKPLFAVLGLLGVTTVVAIASFILLKPDTPVVMPKQMPTNKRSVLCIELGTQYLQCENIETGELQKFVLPEDAIIRSTTLQSPDGKHMISSSFRGQRLVDGNFKLMKELPYNVLAWVDDSRIIYEEYLTDEEGEKRTLNIGNIHNDETQEIFRTKIDGFSVVGANSEHVFIRMYDDAVDKMGGELAAISISDGSLNFIDTRQVEIPEEDSRYDLDSGLDNLNFDGSPDLFYANNRRYIKDSVKHYFHIAKLEKLQDGLQLTPVYTSDYYDSYEIIFTSRGYVELSHSENPHVLSDGNGNKRELKLARLADESYFYYTFETMPNLQKADKAEAEASDVIYISGYPTKIDEVPESVMTFLESQAMKDLPSNVFRKVRLQGIDGTEQILVVINDRHAFFKFAGDNFQKVELADNYSCADLANAGMTQAIIASSACDVVIEEGL